MNKYLGSTDTTAPRRQTAEVVDGLRHTGSSSLEVEQTEQLGQRYVCSVDEAVLL